MIFGRADVQVGERGGFRVFSGPANLICGSDIAAGVLLFGADNNAEVSTVCISLNREALQNLSSAIAGYLSQGRGL